MKQLFHIEFEAVKDQPEVLSIRFGKAYLSFAITNKTGSVLYQLKYYSINKWDEKVLQEIIDTNPVLANSYYEVLVAYDFPESLIIPFTQFKNEESSILLNNSFGFNVQSSIVSEIITGWQLYNIYAVPSEMRDWVSTRFPAARSWHQYTLGIREVSVTSDEGILLVDFKKDEFVVLAAAHNKVVLTRSFEYSTPEDVLFYLIKLCNQFSFSRDTVSLQLSGLIDKQSSLYKELYQYFINIDFRIAQWDTGSEYPAHFFTSQNDLARCVS